MQSKIVYALAASALLIAFATEALLALQKTRGDNLERTSAANSKRMVAAEAKIAKLKASLDSLNSEHSEKLQRAEAQVDLLKSQLNAQVAVNAELMKSIDEAKRRAEAAAARTKRAPVAVPAIKSP